MFIIPVVRLLPGLLGIVIACFGCAVEEPEREGPPREAPELRVEPELREAPSLREEGASAEELGPFSSCTATATCSTTGGSVSCFGINTCEGYDQNCSVGFRGYVKCDGVYQYCYYCPVDPNPTCGSKQCRIVCGTTGGKYNETTGTCQCC